jgi:hypothetical protein
MSHFILQCSGSLNCENQKVVALMPCIGSLGGENLKAIASRQSEEDR